MKNKLGGWYRIWIILSAIWFTLILLVFVVDYPSDSAVLDHHFDSCLEIGIRTAIQNAEADQDHQRLNKILSKTKPSVGSRRSLLSDFYPRGYFPAEYTQGQILDSLRHSFEFQGADYSNADRKLEAQLNALNSERSTKALNFFLLWLVPVVALFLLGRSAKWIIDGFRKAAP